jgi:hypothetical protein
MMPPITIPLIAAASNFALLEYEREVPFEPELTDVIDCPADAQF